MFMMYKRVSNYRAANAVYGIYWQVLKRVNWNPEFAINDV